jgi:hypothetical protein
LGLALGLVLALVLVHLELVRLVQVWPGLVLLEPERLVLVRPEFHRHHLHRLRLRPMITMRLRPCPYRREFRGYRHYQVGLGRQDCTSERVRHRRMHRRRQECRACQLRRRSFR